MMIPVASVQWMLSNSVLKLDGVILGMIFAFCLKMSLSRDIVALSGSGSLSEAFMSGIVICAMGNVALAAESIFLVSFSSCALLWRVLSLMPKDSTTISTMSEVGVLDLRICAAWLILAPG